jgi:hypothetical protein
MSWLEQRRHEPCGSGRRAVDQEEPVRSLSSGGAIPLAPTKLDNLARDRLVIDLEIEVTGTERWLPSSTV